MSTIPTPDVAKPIPDFATKTFDGDSLLFQSRNGEAGKIDGDQVADYVAVNRSYTQLGNKTIPTKFSDLETAISNIPTPKILSAKLTAGATSITISDASITADCMILPYFQPEVYYNSLTPSVGSVTLTFDEQSVDINIKLEVK